MIAHLRNSEYLFIKNSHVAFCGTANKLDQLYVKTMKMGVYIYYIFLNTKVPTFGGQFTQSTQSSD